MNEMIVAGIDIGSRAAKGIILNEGSILSSVILDTGPESVKTSQSVMSELLKRAGINLEEVKYVVATGYGRVLVPFASENISEISCHARGVNFYFPSVRTILDMGGQDCKAISVNEEGQVSNFIMNDKCAGGTGRFLEMIADLLNIPLSEIGKISLESKNTIPFNTICAVFAKTEAITNLRKGFAKSDILAGLHEAIATRCFNLLKKVTIQKDFSISGGISKNKGMVAKIAEKVGLQPMLSEDPQLIGALGAAIFARERLMGAKIEEMKTNYGYSDATGEYFVTIDTSLCDGCGDCVSVCPEIIYRLSPNGSGNNKAVVREEIRKKLSSKCPGISHCKAEKNCRDSCTKKALNLSW
jgi:predicted CoA-substrate-specific enzyme activase